MKLSKYTSTLLTVMYLDLTNHLPYLNDLSPHSRPEEGRLHSNLPHIVNLAIVSSGIVYHQQYLG